MICYTYFQRLSLQISIPYHLKQKPACQSSLMLLQIYLLFLKVIFEFLNPTLFGFLTKTFFLLFLPFQCIKQVGSIQGEALMQLGYHTFQLIKTLFFFLYLFFMLILLYLFFQIPLSYILCSSNHFCPQIQLIYLFVFQKYLGFQLYFLRIRQENFILRQLCFPQHYNTFSDQNWLVYLLHHIGNYNHFIRLRQSVVEIMKVTLNQLHRSDVGNKQLPHWWEKFCPC